MGLFAFLLNMPDMMYGLSVVLVGFPPPRNETTNLSIKILFDQATSIFPYNLGKVLLAV